MVEKITTDPYLTKKPIPEERIPYFLEERAVFCERRRRYIYSYLWLCHICEQSAVKKFGSMCGGCVIESRRKRPHEGSFNKARLKAPREKADGTRIEWRLDYEDYLHLCVAFPDCHYCGTFLNRGEYAGDGGTLAMLLDRKDSNGHYSLDNCVPCCAACNTLKGENITYDEMHLLMALRRSYANNKEEVYGDEKSESVKAG